MNAKQTAELEPDNDTPDERWPDCAGRCERHGWMDTAAQAQRNADYYRGLVVAIGELLGEQAYIADDGTKNDEVLCDKVPELVHALVAGKDRK